MKNEKISRTQLLKSIELSGGKYTMVHERIKFLADNFQYEIDTESQFLEDVRSWKVKAVLTIHDEEKVLRYSGTAIEKIGVNDVNLTSALENAETSAVGRACAFAGIGIQERISSGDEMEGVDRQKPIVVAEKFEEGKRETKKAEDAVLQKMNKIKK